MVMRFGKAIAALVTASIILLIITSTYLHKSYNHDTLSSYMKNAQENLLQQQIQSFQQSHIMKATQPKDNSTSEILRFVKSINNTLHNLKEWSEYKNHRENLERTLHNTFDRKNITKTNPHVLLSDVNIHCNINYKLIVLVTSFAKHFERRNLIRELWGNTTKWSNKEQWKVVFNVGTILTDSGSTHRRLSEESKKYKDIFMVDTEESFYLLSKKVMIALHWVYQSFKFDFILKVDDDIFVQVDRLMKLLNNEWKDEHFIGHVMAGQPAERKGRYGVSLKEWPKKTYDPYCSGGGYILSQAVIGRMIPHFNWKEPLKIDDAYIGHIVYLAGAKPLHQPHHFYMWNDWCHYVATLIVSHPGKRRDCQEFMLNKSLIEQGRLVDDAINKIDALLKPKTKTEKPKEVIKDETLIAKPTANTAKPTPNIAKPTVDTNVLIVE